MKIGVFDSGIGGKAIVESLAKDLPQADIQYVHDRAHVPYGGREADEIIRLTETALQPLLNTSCDCIVIACNTATAAAIEYLRAKYPKEVFIGLEPMVKLAAASTKTGIITIFATPYTLKSTRYQHLKEVYAANIEVLEPDCSTWAEMIEQDTIDEEHITNTVRQALDAHADVIVLACTHYHWIKARIVNEVQGRAVVLDPSEATNRRVASLLSR